MLCTLFMHCLMSGMWSFNISLNVAGMYMTTRRNEMLKIATDCPSMSSESLHLMRTGYTLVSRLGLGLVLGYGTSGNCCNVLDIHQGRDISYTLCGGCTHDGPTTHSGSI